MSILIYQLGDYKIFKEIQKEIKHDLLNELNLQLKSMNKNKYSYDEFDFKKRHDKIIKSAAIYYTSLV